MGRFRTERVGLVALSGLCQLCMLHQALAGQPFEKAVAALGHPNSNPAARSAGLQLPGGRLDLRPPSQDLSADGSAGADAPASFSDFARRKLSAAAGPFQAGRFPPSAAAVSDAGGSRAAAEESGHIMSPMQTLAHNFRREGLPVARLFETRDSLVHLGLNQKGKPGLWFLHKLH